MFRRLSRRERLFLVGGAVVSALALLVTFVLAPQVRRWIAREAMISLRVDQLSRLHGLVATETSVREALRFLEREHSKAEELLLSGRTPAVAASNLQRLLNRQVSQTGMELQRVDAVGQMSDSAGIRPVPAQIAVSGAMQQLVALLVLLQEGQPLLVVDDLRVSTSPGPSGGTPRLNATISVHGYTRSQEAGA